VKAVRGAAPGSAEEAAGLLREAAGRTPSGDGGAGGVRFVGGGTKLGWGTPAASSGELSTRGLSTILEHNASDLTAVLEAGVPLGEAQRTFAAAGQMLSLDPPDAGGATIGGVFATGDAGPLRHRYGGPRDLVLGMRVALADGTVARSGGRVIKNVAGYDLAKLFCGAFGTLGLVLEVVVRLHPLPPRRATAVGTSDDPNALQAAALAVGRAPLELESFDVRWDRNEGTLLARAAGVAPEDRAREAARLMASVGLRADVVDHDDAGMWDAQRAGQRAAGGAGAVLRVSAVRSELARTLLAARRAGASIIGRAGLGLSWLTLPEADEDALVAAIVAIRRDLAPRPCALQDAPEAVRARAGVWPQDPAEALMRAVKARFDPNGVCNPGIFAGGI
jgi:glycolate oxidase FAD binding subunit